MRIEDARRAVDDAIESLTLEMYRGPVLGKDMERVAGPEASIAIELDRIDSALGFKGHSMFAPMAEKVRHCMIALHEARAALGERP